MSMYLKLYAFSHLFFINFNPSFIPPFRPSSLPSFIHSFHSSRSICSKHFISSPIAQEHGTL